MVLNLSSRRKMFNILVSWLHRVKMGSWGLAPRKVFVKELSRMPENAPSQNRRDVKIPVYMAILASLAPSHGREHREQMSLLLSPA